MKLDQLAYVLVETAKLEEWRAFGRDFMGVMAEDGPGGSLCLRYDEWHYRMMFLPADEERFRAAGWSVRNEADYLSALDDAKSSDVDIVEGTGAECELRRVHAFFSFVDPAGNPHEVCWGRTRTSIPFHSPAGVSGFVTGDLGMGHVVFPCGGDYDAAIAFYRDVMGLSLSDFFARRMNADAPLQRMYFFHPDNNRQHSLALAEVPDAPAGLIHMLVEARTIDDVGRALDRVPGTGIPLVRRMGRHINDGSVSFYVVTPSGFNMEYGCDSTVMDWSRHEVSQISYGTAWGHEWQPGFTPTIKTGAAARPGS